MALTDIQRLRMAQYVRSYLARTAVNYGHKNADYRADSRWMHTLNVRQNMATILDGEGASEESRDICEAAAFFHDVDHFTVDLPYHGVRGAETVKKYLTKEGFSAEFAARAAEAVRGHHFDLDDNIPIADQMRAIVAERSHEAQMLMDAETLDKIGASNILQSVMTLANINRPQMCEVARELTSGWPMQRALNWQATLVTPTGKVMGAQRLEFYEQFLKQVAAEIVINDPFPQPSARTQESLQVP